MTVGEGEAPKPREHASLFMQHRGQLVAMCAAILQDRSAAEDAVQETFARLAACAERLEGDPTAYLFTVARNVCRDELRRRARRGREAVPADEPDGTDVQKLALDRCTIAELWRSLSPGDRLLIADAAAGFSLMEMANRRGGTATAVAQRIHRVRVRMRQIATLPAILPGTGEAIGRAARRLAHPPWGRLVGALNAGGEVDRVAGPVLASLVAAGLTASATGATPAVASVHPLAIARVETTGHVRLPVPIDAPVTSRALPTSHGPSGPVAALHVVPAPPPGVPPSETITSITVSPSYAHDRTAYASGSPPRGCTACTPLFRTTDSGSSWHALPAVGFGDSAILLPASYPADGVIFALQRYTGLLRSDDGGESFHVAVPMALSSAVADPTSPLGHARVFLLDQSTGTLLVYDAGSGSSAPAPPLAPDVTRVTGVFTGPGAAAVFVTASGPISGAALYACASGSCSRVGAAPAPSPVMSDTFGVDRTFFSPTPAAVTASRLGGSATSIQLGTGWALVAILPASDYATTQVLDVLAVARSSSTPTLLRSTRGGPFSPRPIGLSPGTASLSLVTRLGTARLLVPLSAGGLACSTDDGASWHPTC
jgi:RNA polymerase sigma-70 factor (ECF subfamily)